MTCGMRTGLFRWGTVPVCQDVVFLSRPPPNRNGQRGFSLEFGRVRMGGQASGVSVLEVGVREDHIMQKGAV